MLNQKYQLYRLTLSRLNVIGEPVENGVIYTTIRLSEDYNDSDLAQECYDSLDELVEEQMFLSTELIDDSEYN